MRNYFLYFLLLIAIAIFVAMSIFYKSEAHRFFGLANSDALEINYPYEYRVQKLFVRAGESIKKGDVLATLLRNNLTMDKALKNGHVDTFKAEENLKRNQLLSSLKELKLQHKIKIDNINFQLKELRRKERINKELLSTISNAQGTSSSPILLKIAQLKREKKNLTSLYEGQKRSINKQLKDLSSLFTKKVKVLNTELVGMKKEENALKVIAPFDGVISNLNHQPNEDVPAFETLMTLNNAKPTYVKGYISIDNRSQVHVGDKVKVMPLSGLERNTTVTGIIKSCSSNVLPYPNRLKRYQTVEMWGVEVLIEIPENRFILGEKVIVLNGDKKTFNFQELIDYFYQATNK